MSTNTKKLTTELDQTSCTKIEWITMFFKEAGIQSPKSREIVSRAIDFYTEYLEELCFDLSLKPTPKVIKNELYDLALTKKPRLSSWQSLELPKIDLGSFGVFPKYSTLAEQFHRPIKPLPKVRRKQKSSPLPNPDSITVSQPMDLSNEPDVGKLLFNKFENQ